MFSLAFLGGVLLNIGAYLTMRGRIYHSVIAYLLADVCWIFIAIKDEDLLGTLLITTGTVLAAVAFYKMHKGFMNKKL